MTKVLDHGFIKIHNISGPTRRLDREFDADDIDPANVARMSFDAMNSGRTREDDLRLADYLMRNWHTGPFEQVIVWVEMKLPIFVARQWIRHRTASLNEISARYVELPREWYIPEVDAIGMKPSKAKQGRDVTKGNRFLKHFYRYTLNAQCWMSYCLYKLYIRLGIAPEIARNVLRLNFYTQWMWCQDLHNLMHLMSLRRKENAQFETREYAEAIYNELCIHLPETMKLFDRYRSFEHE